VSDSHLELDNVGGHWLEIELDYDVENTVGESHDCGSDSDLQGAVCRPISRQSGS